MQRVKEAPNVQELLAKAQKPSADAMKLHPFYRGKIETVPKSCIRSLDDFAIWYTPGVAAPCRAIEKDLHIGQIVGDFPVLADNREPKFIGADAQTEDRHQL